MERAGRTILSRKGGIELFRTLNRLVKEDFVQAISLSKHNLAKTQTQVKVCYRPIDEPELLDGRRLSLPLWRSTCQL